MSPFAIFLALMIFAGVCGAVFLALTAIVVSRLWKKQPFNLRSALIVQATCLLICLASLTLAAKTAAAANTKAHVSRFEQLVEAPMPAGVTMYDAQPDWVRFGWEDPAYLQHVLERHALEPDPEGKVFSHTNAVRELRLELVADRQEAVFKRIDFASATR